MNTTTNASTARSDSSDTVNLIVALLDRFPEIASLRVRPADATVELTFAIRGGLKVRERTSAIETIGAHLDAYLALTGGVSALTDVTAEAAGAFGFLHVVRDVASLDRQELVVLVTLLRERFGERLVRGAPADDLSDEDTLMRDELAEHAIEAIRDPARRKSLVGFREERRVLVYVMKHRKTKRGRASINE